MGLRILEGDGGGKGLGGKPCHLTDSVPPQVCHDVHHRGDAEGPEEHLQDHEEDHHQLHDQDHGCLDPSRELGQVVQALHVVGLVGGDGEAGVRGEVGEGCLSVKCLVKEVGYEEGKDEAGDPHEDEGDEALGPNGEGFVGPVHWSTHVGHERTHPA